MKTWEHDAIVEGSQDCDGNLTLAYFPELAEALCKNGINLPLSVRMKAVREMCLLILSQRKTIETNAERSEAKELQRQLLDRDIYASHHDIAQCYADYCEEFAAAGWLTLDDWELGDHIGPVDYIAARISK
jgi:hypothetical protein